MIVIIYKVFILCCAKSNIKDLRKISYLVSQLLYYKDLVKSLKRGHKSDFPKVT